MHRPSLSLTKKLCIQLCLSFCILLLPNLYLFLVYRTYLSIYSTTYKSMSLVNPNNIIHSTTHIQRPTLLQWCIHHIINNLEKTLIALNTIILKSLTIVKTRRSLHGYFDNHNNLLDMHGYFDIMRKRVIKRREPVRYSLWLFWFND